LVRPPGGKFKQRLFARKEVSGVKLVKKGQGKTEAAKRHFGQWGIRQVSPEEGSQRLTVSLSHFLPQGGAEMYASPTERVYFGISGLIRVRGKKGDEYLVGPGDVLYIPPGEERSIEAVGTEPATMLVIIVKLD
jgi:quercetin dioxygenase-like cupin family protein